MRDGWVGLLLDILVGVMTCLFLLILLAAGWGLGKQVSSPKAQADTVPTVEQRLTALEAKPDTLVVPVKDLAEAWRLQCLWIPRDHMGEQK